MHMNIESLAPNDNCFQEVAENVWLMDNHKWAIYVWERHRKSSGIVGFRYFTWTTTGMRLMIFPGDLRRKRSF